MNPQRERVLNLLSSVNGVEFRKLIRDFLKPKEADMLQWPVEQITKSDLVNELENMGKLAKFEDFLSTREKLDDETVEENEKEKELFATADDEEPSFTNREDEMQTMLATGGAQYRLVSAPAGYGKTVFLQELANRLRQQENKRFVTSYVAVGCNDDIFAFAKKLSKSLEAELGLEADEIGNKLYHDGNTESPRAMALEIASHIRTHANIFEVSGTGNEKTSDDIKKKNGLALLIDLDGKPCSSILPALLNQFLPALRESLFDLPIFKAGTVLFRVVLAGRYLTDLSELTNSNSKVGFQLEATLQLETFNYAIVHSTVKNYLESIEDTTSQVAAHLLFHTGGHPGCVARVLKLFRPKQRPADDFFSRYNMWDLIVREVVTKVREGIPEQLQAKFDRLSIYRALDADILGEIFKDEEEVEDAYDLAEELTATFLFQEEDLVIHDDIVRRLLAIGSREKDDQEANFVKACEEARTIYENRVQEGSLAYVWAVEHLFQSLQAKIPDIAGIGKKQERAEFSKQFFEAILPQTLGLLAKHRKYRSHHKSFRKRLHQDWEFQFLLNYLLREEQYTSKPFLLLMKQIDEFFEKEVMSNE